MCIQKQADNAGDKTSRSNKVTTEPQDVFIDEDIKDEPLDISENIDAVTGEFITGDIWKRFIASKLFYLQHKNYMIMFFLLDIDNRVYCICQNINTKYKRQRASKYFEMLLHLI